MKASTTYLFLLVGYLLTVTPTPAQNNLVVDSIRQEIAAMETDTVRVDYLNQQSKKLRKSSPNLAMAHAKLAASISQQANYAVGLALSYNRIGVILKNQSQFDSALVYYEKAVPIQQKIQNQKNLAGTYNNIATAYKNWGKFEQAGQYYKKSKRIRTALQDWKGLAKVLNNIGNVFRQQQQLDSALHYYISSAKLKEEKGMIKSLANTQNNIANVYAELKDYPLASRYYLKNQQLYTEMGDERGLAFTAMNLGNVYYRQHQYDIALVYYQQAINRQGLLRDQLLLSELLNNVGNIYKSRKSYEQALAYYHQSLAIRQRIGNPHRILEAKLNIGSTYRFANQPKLALPFLEECLTIANATNNRIKKQMIYYDISRSHQALENYENAFTFYRKYAFLKDSLTKEANTDEVTAMRVKYESEKKDKQILAQQYESKTQQYRIYALGAAITLVSIMAFFASRYYYLKRKAAKQALVQEQALRQKTHEYDLKRIDELISSQEVEKLKAMIDGEEQAKQKIAIELHDNVNSLLKIARVNFESLGAKVDLLEEKQQTQYEKVNSLLDKTTTEIQQIASKLKSGTLAKFGLKPALYELQELLPSDYMQAHISIHGLHERLEANAELELYRIAQELFGNAIKHSEATEFDLQIHQDETGLSLTAEDNGKGFDLEMAQNKGRMGLQNIKTRAEKLKGTATFESIKGEGTTVIVHIPN